MVSQAFREFKEKISETGFSAAIIENLVRNGAVSAGTLAKATGMSIPTATKAMEKLIKNGLVIDCGKQRGTSSRSSKTYALNPAAGYFAGVEIHRHHIEVGISDMSGNLVYESGGIPFLLEEDGAYEALCGCIKGAFAQAGKYAAGIIACTISVPGRVHNGSGESFNYFADAGKPLGAALEERLGMKVYIDNDSRIICYGEYLRRRLFEFRNILYINVNWGLGMGLILDGKLYYGSTGLAGELGHITMFDNEIFCRCGKKGCLETEASGFAAKRLLLAKHAAGARSTLSKKIENNEEIVLDDLINAIRSEDMLMIEIIEEIGNQLGKGVAAMINIFNPDRVILGGELAKAGEYLRMAVVGSVRKYSISIVNRETSIELADTALNANLLGCCFIARDRTLGII
ncbi:MAG: ROK family transcriptional regulator [Bacteroidales bacterium]|nr:ROK family transcriptional regulator [Candidatus Cryptobacteroides aphodequi]